MVMAQDPELLLVDEPVAGMTDEETERTGELLLSIAAERSVLVIEHDMEFVRQIARTVTVLHQGTRALRGPGGAGAERSAGAGGLSRPAQGRPMLSVETARRRLRRLAGPVGRGPERAGRAGGLPHGPQRRRQDDAARAIMGLLPARAGRIVLGRTRTSRAGRPTGGRAPGIGYVPQGREIFPHLSVEENLRMALLGCGRATSIDDALDLFPALKRVPRPQGRRAVGRRAADAGHRPRAAHAPQAAHARRADRRHPALDHPRDRGGDPAHQDRARRDGAAGRAVSRIRRAAGRQLRDHGQGQRRGRRRDARTSRSRWSSSTSTV